MDQEFIGEVKATLEDHGHRIHGNSQRIAVLESDQKELVKISTLMERQLELNKEQSIQHKELSVQLTRQNDALIQMKEAMLGIHKTYEKLDGRVENLENYNSSNKIDPFKLFKGFFGKFLIPIILSILITYFTIKLGLK